MLKFRFKIGLVSHATHASGWNPHIYIYIYIYIYIERERERERETERQRQKEYLNLIKIKCADYIIEPQLTIICRGQYDLGFQNKECINNTQTYINTLLILLGDNTGFNVHDYTDINYYHQHSIP